MYYGCMFVGSYCACVLCLCYELIDLLMDCYLWVVVCCGFYVLWVLV